jgi:hypothetical protein
MIPVSDEIAAIALGGKTDLLKALSEAYRDLNAAHAAALGAIEPGISQVLADGIARQNGSDLEAILSVQPSGKVVVFLGDETGSLVDAGATPSDAPQAAPAVPNGNGKLPSMAELRKRAEAAGADISDLGAKKKKILARIEEAEAKPEVEVPESDAPEPEAPELATPEPVTPEPEEEDDLGEFGDVEDDDLPDDDDEIVESPENEEGAEAVVPSDDVDVDNWLDDDE